MRFLGWPKIDRLLGRRCGKKIDLLIVPNFNFIRISRHTPYILVVHDLSFELFPEFYPWKHRLWHYVVQPRRVVRDAAQVIAVSECTKRDLIELYGVQEDKVKVIYPGVTLTGTDPVQGQSLLR